ncbi:MAG: acylphosphatase [bacterium]|nr:acylphosphatase [bacterium]
MQEMHCNITGRVQGVFFRDFVQRHATRLGLTGYVRNCDDDSVEVVAEGERGALETLLKELREGSMLARVENVHVSWRTPRETYDEFNIVY